MTEKTAIEVLRTDCCYECSVGADNAVDCEYEKCGVKAATKAAIQSLEEIQEYRAIGTVEEFKALKEKEREVLLKDGQLLYQQGLVDGYAKAITEFTERLKERIVGMQMAELQGEDMCPCAENGKECPYINQDIGCQYCAREHTIKDINEIAEEMRGGEKWETQLKIMKRKDVKREKKHTKKCKKWFLMYWLKGLVFQGK